MIRLDQLPSTSSVIRANIRRAYFDIRNDITLLGEPPLLDPLDFSWKECDGVLLPDKNLNPIPESLLKLCGCAGKCDSAKCSCTKSSQICVIYCHKKVLNSSCVNKWTFHQSDLIKNMTPININCPSRTIVWLYWS